MEDEIKFRCDTSFKEDVEQHAKNQGFTSTAEYIRVTLKKDMEKNAKA